MNRIRFFKAAYLVATGVTLSLLGLQRSVFAEDFVCKMIEQGKRIELRAPAGQSSNILVTSKASMPVILEARTADGALAGNEALFPKSTRGYGFRSMNTRADMSYLVSCRLEDGKPLLCQDVVSTECFREFKPDNPYVYGGLNMNGEIPKPVVPAKEPIKKAN